MDFEAPLAASGLLETVSAVRWWEPQAAGERVALERADLLPFREQVVNYHSRKVCTFRKDPDALQVLAESDFSPA